MVCNVLISACLLGVNCRYNGVEKPNSEVLKLLECEGIHLVPICPEQMGGLSTPRLPAEISSEGKVVRTDGVDVTEEYCRGAREALKLAKLYRSTMAILKERSPSCGKGRVYDGTFTGTLTQGNGIAADLLMKHGVEVLGESELSVFM